MKGLLADLQHAWRIYRRTPVASSMAVLVLAVAMAFIAAFFSLYVDLVLRPHPGFEQSSRVVTFGWNNGENAGGLPYDLIARIAEESVTLDAAAGTAYGPFEIGPEQEQVFGEMVTRQFFTGVRPRIALGRGLEPSDHELDSELVAVISHRLWQQRFGGTSDVLGTTIDVRNRALPVQNGGDGNGQDDRTGYRIVGVMSPRFTGTVPLELNDETSIWVPAETAVPPSNADSGAAIAFARIMRGIGRSAPGTSAETIINELSSRYQEDLEDVVPLAAVRFDVLEGLVFNAIVHRNTQRQLVLFLSGSILLALVAAANVSLFLLARAPGRRREIGIRMSVGAPLKRITRQLASEASLLVAVAAVLGLVLSVWLAEFLRGLTFLRQAQWRDVALFDWRVLAAVGIFLLILAVLVSFAPILGLKRLGIAGSSRQVAARATAVQHVAGTAQIAVAGMLGGAAIAFGWYLGTLIFSSPGYETRNLHAVVYTVPRESLTRLFNQAGGSSDGSSPMERLLVEETRQRETILSLPGVTDVSLSRIGPGRSSYSSLSLAHPDNPNDQVQVRLSKVDSRFVDLLGLELLHGRAVTDGEAGVLVNRALARRLFGRTDVAGEQLTLPPQAGQPAAEIVGVLEDVSFEHPAAEVRPVVLVTSGFFSTNGLALIESASTPGQLRRSLQTLVESGALEVEIGDVSSFGEAREELIAADRARGFLIIGTAMLVVVLAGSGFYGTQRYLVTAGRREYAIRASVGAGPRAIGRLVLRRGVLLGMPGLVLGTLLTVIVVAWLRDDFVSREVSPLVVTLVVVIGIALILLVASLGPAAQARRIKPAPLLRED